LKTWGDALLDVAETQGGYIKLKHTRILDHLVGSITDIFGLLNCGCRITLSVDSDLRRDALQTSDTQILRLLEEAAHLMKGLRCEELAIDWIDDEARAFHRKLRTLRREIEYRNALLNIRRPGAARRRGTEVHAI
jgi:hypothetical protein